MNKSNYLWVKLINPNIFTNKSKRVIIITTNFADKYFLLFFHIKNIKFY